MNTPLKQPFWRDDDNDNEESSPLGDYLADAESSFDGLGSPFSVKSDEDTAITHRSRRARRSLSSSSRSQSTQQSGHQRVATSSPLIGADFQQAGPSRIPMETPRHIDSAFAERFKYLIASSGLLEKTQLDLSSTRSSEFTASEAGSQPASPQDPPIPTIVETPPDGSSSKASWDVLATVGVIVAGLACVLGPGKMVPTTALAAGLASLLHPAHPKHESEDDDDDDTLSPASAKSQSSPESVYASFPPSPSTAESREGAAAGELESISSRLYASLESLLGESRNLDQTITTSLQILAPYPNDTGHAHDLRVALNKLLDDLTDSYTACTSTLIPLADRSELAVLGEMYDIPVLGPRRPRRHSSGEMDKPHTHASTVSEPPSLPIETLAASPFDPEDRFTKLPDRTLRQKRASLMAADWGSPSPTHRALKGRRIPESTDEGMGSGESMCSTESSSGLATLPEVYGPTSPSRSQAFAPKRASPLAQTLERLEGSSAPLVAGTPPFPVLNASNTNYRRSLQDIRYIHSVPTSSSEAAANLALARASANLSTANRRSLQQPIDSQAAETLQQAIMAAGANLHRAQSLPQGSRLRPLPVSPSRKRTSNVSDRSPNSMARIFTASERHITSPSSSPTSRRTSLNFVDQPTSRSQPNGSPLGIGLAPECFARPSRIASVSPLTLGGLKASYLGVHLKRRRVACCLLGLRFSGRGEADLAYWDCVSEALHILTVMLSLARERLDAVRMEAEKEAEAAKTMASMPPASVAERPHSAAFVPTTPSQTMPCDFAPRDTTEQALLANVDELQRTLARVWARCDEMRTRVASGEAETLGDTWSEVRTDIGGLLRHVERGRELSRRDEGGSESALDYEDETPTPPMPIPEFLRRWADPGPEELEHGIDKSLEETEPEELLPMPGADEVFEADIAEATPLRAHTTMSREERILLTREARAKGLSLAQLMNHASQSPEEREKERQRQQVADRMRAESEMILELEGMFGAIRKRKGMAEE